MTIKVLLHNISLALIDHVNDGCQDTEKANHFLDCAAWNITARLLLRGYIAPGRRAATASDDIRTVKAVLAALEDLERDRGAHLISNRPGYRNFIATVAAAIAQHNAT